MGMCVVNTTSKSVCAYKHRRGVNKYCPFVECHSSDLNLFAL